MMRSPHNCSMAGSVTRDYRCYIDQSCFYYRFYYHLSDMV